ncbi:MAG: IgGFc-binding protein [Myxococcales bacterium]|nr:IgGFc-binding protein [Myxococcales bacterium]MCB9530985.1 IgGFc-binding protein [Myxococcales bacterium]
MAILGSSRRALGVMVFGAAAAALVGGCGDDGVAIQTGCPAGQLINERGVCVDDDRTGGRDTGGGVETDAGADVSGLVCLPGTATCADPTTRAVCAEDGQSTSSVPCGAGETCADGACAPATGDCVPGAVLRCDSPTALRLCGADGTGFTISPCPAATPNCFDGECTDQVCAPSARRCDGASIIQCNPEGTAETLVQECELGCNAGQCVDPCAGDGKTYLGCSFYAADLDNIGGDGLSTGADEAQFAVTVSNATSNPVDVRITGGNLSAPVERAIAPRALETFELPTANIDGTGQRALAYRVESTGPVTVHQFNPLNNVGVFSNDASLLLPSTSVGSEYLVASWPSQAAGLQTFVAIIAVSEGTTSVAVTSPQRTDAGGGVPALEPNVESRFTLAQGEVLSFQGLANEGADLSGMRITSDHPVAVFAGSECANVPLGVPYCDHLEEQLMPVSTWGREFVGAKFRPRGTEPDVWRVVASEAATTLQTSPPIPGVNGRTVSIGEVVEFVTADDFVLFADRPITLAQFMVGSSYPGPDHGCSDDGFVPDTSGCAIPRTCDSGSGIGDPAFLVNVPTAQFRSDYIVLTPAQYEQNFMTAVGPPGTVIRVDSVEVTAARSRIGVWEVVRFPANAGVHAVSASEPIGLYAYGYDCDVSYAYPGGLNLDAL